MQVGEVGPGPARAALVAGTRRLVRNLVVVVNAVRVRVQVPVVYAARVRVRAGRLLALVVLRAHVAALLTLSLSMMFLNVAAAAVIVTVRQVARRTLSRRSPRVPTVERKKMQALCTKKSSRSSSRTTIV